MVGERANTLAHATFVIWLKTGKKKQETHQMVVIKSLSVDYLLAFGFHARREGEKRVFFHERVHFLEFSSSCLAKRFLFLSCLLF